MFRTVRTIGLAVATAAVLVAAPAQAAVILIDFSDMSAFANGTLITNEFQSQGVVFSEDPSGLTPTSALPPGRGALGPFVGQEHIVTGGLLFNLFRADLSAAALITSVRVGFGDNNIADQLHTLFAFDAAGNEVDFASVQDNVSPGLAGDFELSVSSASGIATIVAMEGPAGAERLRFIEITTASVPAPATLLLLAGFAVLRCHRPRSALA